MKTILWLRAVKSLVKLDTCTGLSWVSFVGLCNLSTKISCDGGKEVLPRIGLFIADYLIISLLKFIITYISFKRCNSFPCHVRFKGHTGRETSALINSDNLCKQFGPRSGPRIIYIWLQAVWLSDGIRESIFEEERISRQQQKNNNNQ